jgi:uncharacterized RDD family membrane protein YckC
VGTLSPAGLSRRAIAAAVDWVLVGILSGLLSWLLLEAWLRAGSSWAGSSERSAAGIFDFHGATRVQLCWVAVLFVSSFFYSVIWHSRLGATPGKLLVGLAVVDARGGAPISTRQAVLRFLGALVGGLGLGLGFVLAWREPSRRAAHDFWSGTCVIRRARLGEREVRSRLR